MSRTLDVLRSVLAQCHRVNGQALCVAIIERAISEEERRCPCCGSNKTAPTKGNAVNNETDCLACGADFTAGREAPLRDGRHLDRWPRGVDQSSELEP
jgi:hypothetical protein